MTAEVVANLSEAQFRAAGLSAPKIRTLLAVAHAVMNGLDLERLAGLPEQEARERLTAVKGIGPWTADIYLMFCVGHADVLAAGDLALQVAAQMALDLDERPSAKLLAALAADLWAPWRAVAARLLWAYYAKVKAEKSGMPI